MVIYTQLLGVALVPVALSVLFYLLKRKTSFFKLKYWTQQLIIGLTFGAAAVFGTECGVNIGTATINARDAAPLCAGLLFGAPAGILAGLIGGVERWIAVAWGAGAYSRVACSVSTVLAGFYAAVLRKYMFDDKRPTAGFGCAVAVVMEVLHLSILFLTHLSAPETAYAIVKVCTVPMVVCNAVSVTLAIFLVSVMSHGIHPERDHMASIAQKVQVWMLVFVVLGYAVTTVFVYALQTSTALQETNNLLTVNISDVRADVTDTNDENLLAITKSIRDEIQSDPGASLKSLETLYNVSEISVINKKGIITRSTEDDFVGFDMSTGEQSSAFLVLNQGTSSMVQDFQNISFNEENDSLARKYAGYALSKGGFVQVGYDSEKFREVLTIQSSNIAKNRHIGKDGFVLIANNRMRIISDHNTGKYAGLADIGILISEETQEHTRYLSEVEGVPCYWMYENMQGCYIVAVFPQTEAMESRDAAAYVNSYMEVIVFAVLFALIYFLIKKLVVNNIRSVNRNLKKIIGGNLGVTVNVRTSTEFCSLSDDINSTVTTLKHYIAEAAARIDKELTFAKSIQLSALPSPEGAFDDTPEVDLYATMATAKEVGGDFYDFYKLDDGKVGILIADVSGKGIPAAMFMMQAKTMIKNFAETGLPVNEIFTRANAKLCEGNDAEMFVTAWLGIIDLKTGHVTFANAGHNPPLLYRRGEGFSYLRSRAGLVLAGMDGLKYKLQEFDMAPGDRIYLYTDGVTEATDAKKELYGEDRLLAFLNKNSDLTAKNTLRKIKEDIDLFVGEAEQFDDITMLMLDYFGEEKGRMLEKKFNATTQAVPEVSAFVEGELEKAQCGMKAQMQIAVALEEIFVNVAHYAYPEGVGPAWVGVSTVDGVATVRVSDMGRPFDPLAKQDPDVTLSAEERDIGGLGIFMVKKTMDDVTYKYENGKNILTLVKKM